MSRGKGKSAVAAAAYRSGEKITNEWDGLTHDYTRKGGVVYSQIMLPPHAPPSFSDRSALWNSVELFEKSNNAQLAREVEIALPAELSREEQIRLIREYCSSQFVSKGMCADFSIHDTGGGNPHCHILLTMRPIDERGKWLPKSKKEYVLDENGERIQLPSGKYKTRKVDLVDWNKQENAELWRKAWADMANSFLEQSGHVERIDYRSYERQGIDQIPTVHVGVSASQMEKKGIVTERGELNRNIKAANRLFREICAQIGKLKEWLADLFQARNALQAEPQPPKSPDLSKLLFKYIEKLVKDGFVKREKKQMIPTEDGMKLITVLPDMVKSPKLIADWENALTLVAKGEMSGEEFMEGIEGMVRDLVQTYHSISDNQKSLFGGNSGQEILGRCPKCGGDVVKGKFGAYCRNRCGMNVGRAMGAALSDSQIRSMLEGKRTLVKGLKGKKGSYDAYLIPKGLEDYSYTKDGRVIRGIQYKVRLEFKESKK